MLDEAKQQTRATWSAGDYDAIVDYIWSAGGDLVERAGVQEGDRVLDVALRDRERRDPSRRRRRAGDRPGPDPELFDDARRRADAAGVEVEWVEGDAEALPYDDGSLDVVLSTFGCMFAPRHEVAAAEIARVLRPSGRFGIASWTPEGSIGRFFEAIRPFAPEPPPGYQPPLLWGTREHVSELFGGTGVELRFEDAAIDFRFESVEAATDEYWNTFPPIVMLRKALEPEGRTDEFREALKGTFEASNRSSEGDVAYPGEYLVALGERGDG